MSKAQSKNILIIESSNISAWHFSEIALREGYRVLGPYRSLNELTDDLCNEAEVLLVDEHLLSEVGSSSRLKELKLAYDFLLFLLVDGEDLHSSIMKIAEGSLLRPVTDQVFVEFLRSTSELLGIRD